MRDILVSLIIFGGVPFVLSRPYIGVLLWSWLGYMNPHRLTYGFAFNFPFSQVVAAATLIAIVFSSEKKKIPWHPIVVFWLLLVLWMNVTTLFSINHDEAISEWNRTMKIMLMVLITLLLMQKRERLHLLVWIIAMSLAFFGVKGGIFSLATGGNYKVWGPAYSFIEGNNELALALVMTIPLMRYLQLTTENKWIKRGILIAIGLTAISVLTSFSRGALLASTMMALFLAWKSPNRARMFAGMVLVVPIILSLMPQTWWDRMNTIQSYQEDGSAMGRINAWHFATNLALDRPLVGGGFQAFSKDLFKKYAPVPDDFHDAHSIYFEMLGEQGFVGLILFLLVGAATFITGNGIIRDVKDRADLSWARYLASMIQVSLIGYATGGAFLGLGYYDLPYHLVAIMAVTRRLVTEAVSTETPAQIGSMGARVNASGMMR